jgi:hypothetical protein
MKPITPLRTMEDYLAWEQQDRERIDAAVRAFYKAHREQKPAWRPRWLLFAIWAVVIVFAGLVLWLLSSMGMLL